MKTKMTPGPWFCGDDDPCVCHDLTDTESRRIATLERCGGLDSEEVAANARAISAVPELIMALANLIFDWERVQGRSIPEDHEAKAALRKAGWQGED